MIYFDYKFSFLIIFTLQLLCIAHVRVVPSLPSLQSLSARQSNVSQALDWDPSKTPFPVVRRDDTTFTYISASKGHVTVADPYNWFEQVDAEKDEIEAFRLSQISFTKEYLKNIKESDQIHTSLEQAKNCTQVGVPSVYGVEGSLLYAYTVLEANQTNTIYYIANQDEMDEAVAANFTHFPGKPYFDTALLGVNRTIYGIDISPDAKKVLYTVFETEYNLDVWTYVRDISNPLTAETTTTIEEGGKGHYPDVIPKAPIADWAPDSESIIYVHNDIRNSNISYNRDSIRYHKLGTDLIDDLIIVPEPSDVHHFFNFIITDDLRYFVVLYGQEVDGRETSRLYATSLDQPIDHVSEWKWIPITVDDSSDYFMMTNIGEDFYFNSRNGSEPRKIVHFSLDFQQAKQVKNLNEDLTENIFPVQILIDRNFSNGVLAWTTFDTNKVMIEYDENDRSEILVYDLFTGNLLQNISLDAFSVVNNLQSFPTAKDIYVSASSLDCPNKLYKMEWDSEKNQTKDLQLFYQANSNFIKPENFVVERKWIPSTDGIEIPATFLHRKDLQLDGTYPSLIEIYGGYGVNTMASFNFLAFALAHSYDVVYVLAGIRGGGEVGGEAWHEAGMLGNKHHSFEDTIATANYLVDEKYSSPGKILLYGEASGAMSSAAVINQAPQGLFGALITYRGIFDMLRMDKSPGEGKGRVAEYGDPHNPEDFDWLYAYSPLHNIQKDKKYPIIVLIPGKDDDLAEPWHVYKYISTLQYLLPSNPNPIFMTDSHQDVNKNKLQAFEVIIHGLGLQSSSKS